MWKLFAAALLRHRTLFAAAIILITAFMGYEATKMQLSYEFAKILPDDDSTNIAYQDFRKRFGEDGNIMVVGFQDSVNLFKFEEFRDWHQMGLDVKNIQGVSEVLSLPMVFQLIKDDSLSKFDYVPVLKQPVRSQEETDSIKKVLLNLPFYEGIVYSPETKATNLLITFNKKDLDSKRRLSMVKEITDLGKKFETTHGIKLHYSGMPYIRASLMTKVSGEMTLFLVLAVFVTGLILWLFFRTISTVIFSLVVVAFGVVWSIGIMELFGYRITVLSGLIAPLMMVIGVPNCIFLINKYQREFLAHGDKFKAIARSVETIGVSLFLANITTAIGFAVLYFTKSSMLVEFGVVASISVLATYFITLILIPVILSVLPTPKPKHTRHQDNKFVTAALVVVDRIVQTKRGWIYGITAAITVIALWGMRYMDFNSKVVDDLPQKDPVYEDMAFFEKNFRGVLPFEIAVDTKKKNGLFAENAKALYRIKRLQSLMAEYPEFSKPISFVEGVKFLYQTYRGGAAKYYRVPPVDELNQLKAYTSNISGQGSRLKSFIDSTRQYTRISYQAADIGSKRMKVLMANLKPRIDSILDPAEYNVHLTGHSLVFLKSNDYLLSNLIESLVIEIILIAIVGIALFRSVRIIVLSKLPCLIPLVVTAGFMGFMSMLGWMDTRFKPSTILVFSIAFGISSDGTIYFLTRYRQELMKMGVTAEKAISAAIHDTGRSMIYTSVILFCGFSIFTASSFGGTQAMGVLVSLTLLMSMFTNLILLPAILLSIYNAQMRKKITEVPLIAIDEEEQAKDL